MGTFLLRLRESPKDWQRRMDGNGSLSDALAILDQQIATRERELGELRAARRHLVALVPQESLLDEPQPPAAPRTGIRVSDFIREEVPSIKRLPANVSIPEAAAIIVREIGRPMAADAIARAMLARGHKYDGTFNTLVDTVRGTLGREVRRKRTFDRFGRGKFGLLEWSESTAVQQSAPAAPEEEVRQEAETA